MAMTEIRVTVVSAEDLKRVGLLRKMSVYSLVWIDPSMKEQTRVHRKGGRNPVWNDELVFSLGGNVLLFPHSTISIQVMSQGKRKHKLLGTTFIPLAEIARIKAMKDDPEEYDSVQLQLTTPSGHLQGYICLCISLIDRSERLPSGAPMFSNQSAEPVMGYPVGLPPNMAYYNALQFQPTPHETIIQQGSSSGTTTFQASSRVGSGFPVPTPPAGVVLYYPRGQEGSSGYTVTPYPYGPSVDIRSRRPRRANAALAMLGGALSGLILGEVIF